MWTALRINIYPRWVFHYSRLFKPTLLKTRKQLIHSTPSNVYVLLLWQLAGLTFVEITVQKSNQVTQKWFIKEPRHTPCITTPSIATVLGPIFYPIWARNRVIMTKHNFFQFSTDFQPFFHISATHFSKEFTEKLKFDF